MRDTQTGVQIDFLVTGDFPGDGKPKPVSFPDPADVAVDIGGVSVISLPRLVELKLASGMTNANRLKDPADVLELIKVLKPDASFGDAISPFVRDKFLELLSTARTADPSEDY